VQAVAAIQIRLIVGAAGSTRSVVMENRRPEYLVGSVTTLPVVASVKNAYVSWWQHKSSLARLEFSASRA